MSFISRLFHKEDPKTGGMEDYMTLVRVYFQSAIASQVGITNLAMLPDLRAFKSTFHVATVNNKLGLGEKAYCKKMMQSIYQTDDDFFDEVDKSIRKNCRKNGVLYDVHLMSMLREEYEERYGKRNER